MRIAFALLLGACARYVDGPEPSVLAVVNHQEPLRQPAVVCNAQGDATAGWQVDVLGEGFAVLPTGKAGGKATALLPEVTLTGPEPFAVPAERTRFFDSGRLVLELPTSDSASAKALTVGSYALAVRNPDSQTTKLGTALTVVGPPRVDTVKLVDATGQEIDPVIRADQTQKVVIHGDGFRPDAKPVVTIGAARIPDADVSVTAPTTLTLTVRSGTLAAGTSQSVRVANPEGCAAPRGADPTGFGITEVRVVGSAGAAP